MSALPPKADMCSATRYVRYVPIADIRMNCARVDEVTSVQISELHEGEIRYPPAPGIKHLICVVPIPLVRKDGVWRFDTTAGRQEILARRIGKNELDAIQASLAYVDAQNDYAEKDRTGAGVNTYAQRIISQPGKKDGVYWPTSQGGEASPLGELVAQATVQGYPAGGGRAPFHGYYFKILTKQGAAAPGGELEYVVRSKMIGEFALVAYPAEYRNSGVMTFIVSHAGTVFQKDLGPDTAKIAERMSSFNPDKSWQKVDDTTPPK